MGGGTGIVVRSTGSACTVLMDDGTTVEASLRGRLRLRGVRSTSPVAVGDRVTVAEGAIADIEPRRNYMIRRASNLSRESHILAANIDGAVLVATLTHPEVRLEFIDRFLVTCEAYGIPATIVLNKVDLRADAEEFTAIYNSAGYRVLGVSAHTGAGLDELRLMLQGKTTLFAGNSGVGKSSLIKALIPSADPRTGAISDAHNKGRHTTTYAQMYEFPNSSLLTPNSSLLTPHSFIIDTPGVKGFGLIDINAAELARYYPEMMRRVPQCRFPNCTHTHEPDCAVIAAVQNGGIAPSRYESYLKTLDEDGKYR